MSDIVNAAASVQPALRRDRFARRVVLVRVLVLVPPSSAASSSGARAPRTSRGVNTTPPTSARPMIMIGPPTNSASANCQPISTSSTMPSSTTRFVDANMKIIAVVKSAPFWNSDFAIAVAA